jgi:subtilisin family serine protease
MKRRLIVIIAAFATAFAAIPAGAAPDRGVDREVPDSIESLKLDSPVEDTLSQAELDRLASATGPQRVMIRLVEPSVAETGLKGRAAANARKAVQTSQEDLLERVLELDPSAEVVASVQLVLNAVFVEAEASALVELADDPSVARIVRVADYQLDLSETVPYIGGSAVQDSGFDGSGVKVAVLDSGIDYTHANLGGGGTLADYEDAYGTSNADPANTTLDGLFPTAKVVGGYDFVGENWPNSPEEPDPDPIDFEGHGTHVADIIGGLGGVAPGVDLYAVKVCSAVSSSCSGIALIQGMEFSVDPDGDGDPSDAVDVINMSLGSTYGQPFDDDLVLAVDNATALGVLTVASAGNSADKPYVTGTPAAARTALSVAQTQVPRASLPQLLVTNSSTQYILSAVFQSWSVAPQGVFGPFPVVSADSIEPGNGNGCAPFTADLAGKIVLIDRGACNFTLKALNGQNAGAEAVLIGLVAPGDPFDGGDGGDGPITIPTYMISQADSLAISGASDVTISIDPALNIPLVGQMVGSSSRGPSNYYNQVKPEIGAPGASVSAIAGSGTGEGPFGGTSGAAPMVSGAAALVLQTSPNLIPAEVKSLLMNTAETAVDTDPFTGAAPITRIGGGEVRVDQAVTSPAAAWDDELLSGALSFGYVEVAKDTTSVQRKVRLRNYSNEDIEYTVTPSFRDADDEASGAVSVSAPTKVKVRAGKDATFTVKLTIAGDLLSGNFMNSGSQGANPAALTANEFDGYLTLDDGENPIHLAWHVLPRQSSELKGRKVLTFRDGVDSVALQNTGVGTAQNDAYALLALSDDDPEGPLGGQSPTPDIRAVGVNTFPVPAGFCSGQQSFIWAFAVNTWEPQSHLVPVSHQIELDTNQDGLVDYVVLNRDFSGPGTISDGRQLSWVFNVNAGTLGAFFFAEHATNTGNTVLLICGEQIGLTGTDMLSTNVDVNVVTQDFYFGGPGDLIEGLTITPLGERYFGIPEDVAGKSSGSMDVIDFGPFPGNSAELGIMLLTNGDRGTGARGGATADTEALLFLND